MQTIYILTSSISNKVKTEALSLIETDEDWGKDSPHPKAYVAPGNIRGTQKVLLADGIDSEAAFVCEGNAGENWAMYSGCKVEIRGKADPEGIRRYPTQILDLHNRYEVPQGNARGARRRA